MKLIRNGDRHSQKSNLMQGSKYDVRINFWGFGKGKERGSDFAVTLDIEDIVLIVSKMTDGGHEAAKWLEEAMRANSSLAAILEDIDKQREAERQEEEFQRIG